MDPQWKFWLRQLRSGSLEQDRLGHVTVGDPDPTSVPGAKRYQKCGFQWADPVSHALILRWVCTREPGHRGQHLAGTGEQVAAVHPPLGPTAAVARVAV